MPIAMRSGRARISLRHPRALGECDRCGFIDNHDRLIRQRQWAGNTLRDVGLLVCGRCLDVPQDQYRTVILPPDPFPILNARPSPNFTPVPVSIGQPLPTSPENQGFTVYTLGIITIGAPTSGGSSPFILDQSALDGPDVMQ